MKTIVKYKCEICQDEYDVKGAAIECEKRGVPQTPPVGLVFGSTTGFYKDITFCVASTEVSGHYVDVFLWACRDNNANGDTLGKDRCGGSSSYSVDDLKANMRKHPTFKRMIKYLKKAKIKPLITRRGKVVPLK